MKYFLISLVALLSSCTYSVIMNHSEGTATDMVDEGQAPSTTLTPTVTLTPAAL